MVVEVRPDGNLLEGPPSGERRARELNASNLEEEVREGRNGVPLEVEVSNLRVPEGYADQKNMASSQRECGKTYSSCSILILWMQSSGTSKM